MNNFLDCPQELADQAAGLLEKGCTANYRLCAIQRAEFVVGGQSIWTVAVADANDQQFFGRGETPIRAVELALVYIDIAKQNRE